jgi:hypothetical protein
MPATHLQFYQVGSYPYPYATTGTGSGLTVCRRHNDSYLACLTQTEYEDEIVFLIFTYNSILSCNVIYYFVSYGWRHQVVGWLSLFDLALNIRVLFSRTRRTRKLLLPRTSE